jgi:hypothetical protein
MAKNFDGEIAAANQRLKQLNESLVLIRREFLSNAATFLKSYFDKEARDQVMKNPDMTNSLGDERLKQFKDEVRELQKDVANICAKLVNADEHWWDGQEIISRFEVRSDGKTYVLDKPMRLAAGQLGPILERYGYADGRSWREHSPGASEGKPCSPDFVWPVALKEIAKKYRNTINDAKLQIEELSRLDKEKRSCEAGERWDDL